MKEELQNQLITILPDLKEAMQQGIAYGGDLFNRAITYFIWEQSILLIMCLTISIVLSVILYKIWKYVKKEMKKYDQDWFEHPEMMFCVLLIIPCIMALIFASGHMVSIIKLNIIPEIFIIELLTK